MSTESTENHHEDSVAFNKRFSDECASVVSHLRANNPFLMKNLRPIGGNIQFCDEVEQYIQCIPHIGENQYKTFLKERLILCTKKISDTVTKNKFVTPDKESNDQKYTTPKLCSGFYTKLRTASTYRTDKTKQLLSTEVTGIPESLSVKGEIYQGSKSDFLKTPHFANGVVLKPISDISFKSGLVVDISVLIRAHASDVKGKTYSSLATEIFKDISNQCRHCSRVDIVCDSYFESSIKCSTRSKRGSGFHFSIVPTELHPKNFKDNFLKNSQNKTQLNQFLMEEIRKFDFGETEIFFTNDNLILHRDMLTAGWSYVDNSILNHGCTQDEADSKIILYVFQMIKNNFQECHCKNT